MIGLIRSAYAPQREGLWKAWRFRSTCYSVQLAFIEEFHLLFRVTSVEFRGGKIGTGIRFLKKAV